MNVRTKTEVAEETRAELAALLQVGLERRVRGQLGIDGVPAGCAGR